MSLGEVNRDHLGLDTRYWELFKQFKQNVADILKPGYLKHADDELLKYCLARRWDLKKAEHMFRQAASYREKMRLDHIIDEFSPPEVAKYLTGGIGCFDKEGCPVRIERFGHLDTKGVVYSTKVIDLERFKLQEQEMIFQMMQNQSKKLGKKIDKLTVIMDLDNISTKQLWRPGLQLYLHLVKVLEDNYPEFVKHLIVINAPKIFPILYKVCKPFISDDMRGKIQVYGANHSDALLQLIDEEELPAYLGGKQMGPGGDIYCTHKIKPGGTIPQSFYLKELVDTKCFEHSTVGAGSKLFIKMKIDTPKCVIRWEFLTLASDIAFGIDFQAEKDDSPAAILPIKRVSSHVIPEDGTLSCDRLGIYTVIFDNSFSWTKSKKLLYNIEALCEDEDIADEVKEMVISELAS